MLRIHKSYNAKNTIAYFDKSLVNEGEYYTGDNIVTHWHGGVAGLLSLEGKEVTREVFHYFVNNINSKTKNRLTVRNAEHRRSGFDLVFNVPKSVSALHALTKNDDILKAHQYAYQKAMEAIEAAAQTQANIGDERYFENTGSLIYTAFDHFTTRPNEIVKNGKVSFEPDCHLHSHLYVLNVTWSKKNNRFQALEIGNIHKLANWYENIYHAHLSLELQKLGLQIERTPDRFEIAAVPKSVIDKFSNRTKQINQIAEEKGIVDPKKKAELGAKSRRRKAKDVNPDKLYRQWRARLNNQEFQTLLNAKNIRKILPKPISAKDAIDQSITHFLERNSTAPEKRILAHALSLGYGHLSPDDVQKEFNARDNILRSDIDTITYITTRELVYEENRMIEAVTSGKGKHAALHPEYIIKQDFLNEQQRAAVHTLLNSSDFVTVLRGSAGVGKTSLLTEVRDAIHNAGKSLFSVAPSTQAAQVLRQKNFEADTIAALLIKPELQDKLKNGVLLVDEGSLIGIQQMNQLLALSKKQNARVILSGDTKQHNSPTRGDAQRIIQEKAKPTTAHVQKIVRQKPKEYRTAVEHLSKGEITKGYEKLEQMDAIQEIPEYEARMQKIADDYISSISKNRTALVISPTHHEGDLLSEIIRDQLKSKGKIKAGEKSFKTLKNLSLTDAQKKDPVQYEAGRIVRFTKNQKGGFKAGSHHEILPSAQKKKINIRDLKTNKIMPLPYQTSQYFELYKKAETKIAPGDLIRLTSNSKTLENSKIANGTRHHVTGFTKAGDIKLSNGKTLSKDSYHFKQGYVETSHSSQGKDAQDVFIAQSDLSHGASNMEQFYVSVSRGTQSVQLYTSNKDELKRNITRSSQRLSANDIAQNHTRRKLQSKQRKHHKSINQKIREHGRKEQQKTAQRHISRSPKYRHER